MCNVKKYEYKNGWDTDHHLELLLGRKYSTTEQHCIVCKGENSVTKKHKIILCSCLQCRKETDIQQLIYDKYKESREQETCK